MTVDREHLDNLPTHVRRHILVTDACWFWTGCINEKGYGRASLDGNDHLAHRLVYWLTIGGPLPSLLHHLCREPRCVNPAHLKPENHSTHWDHHRHEPHGYWDRMRARTHCRNGHEFTVANTHWRADGEGKKCRRCAADYERARRARKAVAA